MKTNLFVLLVSISLLILSFSSCKTSSKGIEGETYSTGIEGEWRSVLRKRVSNNLEQTKPNPNEIKIWTKGYYAYTGTNYAGGGTYKLDGNKYEETPHFGGNRLNLKLELKNDTLVSIWPVDSNGQYDKSNYDIIKMVRIK